MREILPVFSDTSKESERGEEEGAKEREDDSMGERISWLAYGGGDHLPPSPPRPRPLSGDFPGGRRFVGVSHKDAQQCD